MDYFQRQGCGFAMLVLYQLLRLEWNGNSVWPEILSLKNAIVYLGKQFRTSCSTSVGTHVMGNILLSLTRRYLKNIMRMIVTWRVSLRKGTWNSRNGLLNGWRRRNWGKQHVDYLVVKCSIVFHCIL